MVLVYYRPKLAMERGTKPDALGTRPYHCTNTLKAAIVKARRAWKDAQTRCHHLLEVADQRQHREHRLYQHTILPLPTLAQFEVRRIPLRGMEAGITQDDHASVDLPNQPLKRVIRHIGGGTRPPDHQAILVEQQTQFASDNPAMVGQAFAPNLLRAPAFEI